VESTFEFIALVQTNLTTSEQNLRNERKTGTRTAQSLGGLSVRIRYFFSEYLSSDAEILNTKCPVSNLTSYCSANPSADILDKPTESTFGYISVLRQLSRLLPLSSYLISGFSYSWRFFSLQVRHTISLESDSGYRSISSTPQ